MFNAATAQLAPQSYGLAMSQCTFGGPMPGIWLECTGCQRSERIVGSRSDPDAISDQQAAAVFRRHGWTGEGSRMLKAKCPDCSGKEDR